ncbi:MAG TPA: DinB family protein [Candidatus Eisenbacteria bacterium]|nr:DinB family protein [Candidatus Eisenbacteria bacterium]
MNSHEFLAAHAPAPTVTPAPTVVHARAALESAGRDLAAIADPGLERPWRWRDHDVDVRYGLFRTLESVEQAAADVAAILAATGANRSAAALRIAPSTVARWTLHGRLVGLDDGWLDRVGKEGEWTVRETLAHIVGGQRGYVAYNAWYWRRSSDDRPTDAERAALDAEAGLPEEAEEGMGTLGEIRARLDETFDEGAAYLGGIPDADLRHRAWWSGIPVDLEFRLGRLSSHTIEHTIQVDKTLSWLDRQPSEAQRIVGDVYTAWGRLEALVFPIEPATLSSKDATGRSVETVLAGLATQIVADAKTARAASEA